MNYKFDITTTDDDYFEFNKFVNFKTSYGRKQLGLMRILIAVIFVAFAVLSLIYNGFSLNFYITAPLLLILLLIYELTLPKMLTRGIKKHIKVIKKSGKMPYSPYSVMEFYEDRFVEITDISRSETLYSSIEKISENENKAIYIHTDVLRGYIIPLSVFESKVQYNEFLDFISAKATNIKE
ncbi:MAG: YcxB family protein [Clostridia bacterium]|nr:YcxB family protein [Clostridia bacterium]